MTQNAPDQKFAGQFAGEALEKLHAAVVQNVEGAEESIHKAMISLCFRTKARIAIAPLQDYLGLGSSARLNTPGTPEGNWRWRARQAELDSSDMSFVSAQVEQSGRH